MRLRKISQDQISGGSVTLAIKQSDDGIAFGRAIAMIATHHGPEGYLEEAPPKEAISKAVKLAQVANRSCVDVVDEDELWQPDWGTLDS